MAHPLRYAVLCALAAFPLALSAQTKWPIRSIQIEGNQQYSDAQLVAVTGLRIGQPADQATFEAGQAELLASGVLETCAFRFGPAGNGQGYAVVYEVAEIAQTFPLHFENIDAPEEELLAWLRRHDPLYTGKIAGTESVMGRYARLIEDYLKKEGKEEPVTGEVTADTPGEFYVLFHPKGAMPVVAEVDFKGNEALTTETLREAINGIAIGTRYTRGNFQLLLATGVRPAYEARGRVDVEFTEVETERMSGDVKGVRVIVTVEEGESYTFNEIRVHGPATMNRELYHATNLKPGEVANLAETSYAVERIKEAMHSAGYMSAKAAGSHKINREKKTVDLTFTVEPGPLYKFGELFIEGLDVHGEHEINRLWGLQPGDPFDETYAEFFLERIRAEGLFDNLKKAEHRVEVHEESATADIVLIFNPEEPRMRFGAEPEPEPRRRGGRRP